MCCGLSTFVGPFINIKMVSTNQTLMNPRLRTQLCQTTRKETEGYSARSLTLWQTAIRCEDRVMPAHWPRSIDKPTAGSPGCDVSSPGYADFLFKRHCMRTLEITIHTTRVTFRCPVHPQSRRLRTGVFVCTWGG